MLAGIIEASLRHRAFVLIAALVAAVSGAVAFRDLPLDAFPDATPVQVTVNTVAPALSPLEIERQVTSAVEQGLGGLPGLQHMRSLSRFGFSQVTLQFADEVDLYRARQCVVERLATVTLPEGIARPSLGPVATGLGEVFHYVVTSRGENLTQARTVHDWIIRPQLRAVPGVAEINAWGGKERQWQVVADPDLLVKHDVALDELVRALERNNGSVGGGIVSAGGEAFLVQGVALPTTTDEVGDIVVSARDGISVRVRDVARVVEGNEIRRGAVTADGKGEVVLGLGFVLMGENGRAVAGRLAERLDEVRRGLPAGVSVEPVYSRVDLVDQVLDTVKRNLLEGALLVVAVSFVFLGDIRAGVIVALAIPLSLLFAFNLMLRCGVAASLMSLGAIDFGLVVDSSVVMVENSARRIAADLSGRSVVDIVRDAALEVRGPTLLGELVIAIVYVPILTLEGVEGKLFRPMALTVIFALVGSTILSLTVVPALASIGLSRRRRPDDGVLLGALKRGYRACVRFALARPVPVLTAATLAVVGAAALATRLGTEFVPKLREGSIVINTIRLASVSLDESVRYGTRIERRLLEAFPDEIQHIWTRTGTAEVATDPMGLELSDVFVTLTPRERWRHGKTQDELTAAMAAAVKDLPGMKTVFTQPIEMRMNEMIAGIRADLGVELFGDDFEVLRAKAGEIARVVEAVPGAADVSVEQVTGLPVLEVAVDRDAAGRYGIAAADVLATVEAFSPKKVGEIREGQTRFDLAVRLDHRYVHDPREVGKILVSGPDGGRVPLGRLARARLVEAPSTIQREWGKRRVVIQANVRGRALGDFVSDVRHAISESVPLPAGYHVDYGGQFEQLERARARLAVVVPLALAMVFALLSLAYGRLADALRVFSGVPFAAVGGVVALWVREMPLSISAVLGFVALSGVSVFGDMVLVSRVRQLVRESMPLSLAIEEAAESRLRPVLMTALVAALGFIPMATSTGIGAEVQRPLATVVIGGLLTSTVATLIVLPVLYAFASRSSARG
ncbi:MAG TPA: CusA/CzcA family heavy metal efflux RND transporter [Planctomycetota bacterium]|nr:CusA/CzcA family heavy metal efflux RND transporter [Planctomycetota bacterium]